MRRKKRLRKKLRVGEFQELGFAVTFEMDAALSTEARNQLLEDFIVHAITPNGLEFGGGGAASEWDGFVAAAAQRASVTEAQRAQVVAWLAQDRRIVRHEVSPLVDAWSGYRRAAR